MSDKPREWWIHPYSGIVVENDPHDPGYETIHVIEKSAYDREREINRVMESALITIECGLVTAMETAEYAGLKPKEIARLVLDRCKELRRER